MKGTRYWGGMLAALLAVLPGRPWAGEIHDAAGAGDVAKVKALLQARPELVQEREPDGGTPLHVAAALGQKAVAEVLLAYKADPLATNLFGLTPLRLARLRGQKAMVSFLLEKNPAPNDKFALAVEDFHRCIAQGETAKAQALLKAHRDLDLLQARDPFGNTALHVAAFSGNREMAAFLLGQKANPEPRNLEDATPLHIAAYQGRAAIVELLLARNVEVSAKSSAGDTPLLLAADQGHVEIARLLLAKKAEGDAVNKMGVTPLLAAADKGRREMVALLLAHHVNVNARGDKDATSLHFAIRNGDLKMVEMLLAAKPDLTARTQEGHTPLGLANQKKLKEIADRLKRQGARE